MSALMDLRPEAHLDVPPPPDGNARWRRVARAGLRRFLKLQVEGAHHVPAEGGVLLAAAHASHADPPAIGAAVPRPCSFVGTATLAGDPVRAWLLPRLGLIPIVRGSADVETLNVVGRLLDAGHAVVVFPEGTRSRDGRVHRPRSGVARLAALTGAPVVPVGVDGTAAVWPIEQPGERPPLPRPAREPVRIAFGEPLRLTDPGPLARRAFNDDLHAALVALSGRPGSDGLATVRRDTVARPERLAS